MDTDSFTVVVKKQASFSHAKSVLTPSVLPGVLLIISLHASGAFWNTIVPTAKPTLAVYHTINGYVIPFTVFDLCWLISCLHFRVQFSCWLSEIYRKIEQLAKTQVVVDMHQPRLKSRNRPTQSVSVGREPKYHNRSTFPTTYAKPVDQTG